MLTLKDILKNMGINRMCNDDLFAASDYVVDVTMVLFVEMVLETSLERYQRLFIMANCTVKKIEGVEI